tara:strand:+ start:5524 stop:6228 length:705 start_codon:yes stop_codon:yes gene_type:complete
MASRLMSAYGNLAGARTDIGRNLSDIAGIGIEMEYGSEGTIAGKMALSKIANQTAAIGLGLESVQQFASMGVSAGKEATRAKEMGELSGTGSVQTKGETRLWDLFRGKADIGEGETWFGEVGERIGTGLGFMDREYEIGEGTYTSSQIEAGSPWAKLGKDWEEVSQLMGGRTDSSPSSESRWEGTFEDLGMTESEFDNSTTTSQLTDQSMIDRVKMYKERNWAPDHTINMDYWS